MNSSNNTARKTLRLFKKQQESHLSNVGWNAPEPKLAACAHMMWVFWTILGYSINSVPKYHYGVSLPYMLIAIVSWSAYLFDILPVLVLVYLPEPTHYQGDKPASETWRQRVEPVSRKGNERLSRLSNKLLTWGEHSTLKKDAHVQVVNCSAVLNISRWENCKRLASFCDKELARVSQSSKWTRFWHTAIW